MAGVTTAARGFAASTAALLFGLALGGTARATGEPASLANDFGMGGDIAWSIPGSGGSPASAILNTGQTSRYLVATDFGYSLPPNARVSGALLVIERGASATNTAWVFDWDVRVVQGGVHGPTNQKNPTRWPDTEGEVDPVVYSLDDAIGLSGEEVNASDFGVALQVLPVFNGTGFAYPQIESIFLAVEYRYCPNDPVSSCTTGFQKGSLLLKQPVGGDAKMVAKLVKGPALSQGDLGVPLTSPGTSYRACFYADIDGPGTDPVLFLDLTIDAPGELCAGKPCWKGLGTSGLLYKDKEGIRDGVRLLKMKGGGPGKSKVLLKGSNKDSKGQTDLPDLNTPALVDASEITMQLLRDDDARCVSGVFDEILVSTPEMLKAR